MKTIQLSKAKRNALVRALADLVKANLLCELNNENITGTCIEELDFTKPRPGFFAEPQSANILLFTFYPNDLDLSGHFLPCQEENAIEFEREVLAHPDWYDYTEEEGVYHEPATLVIDISIYSDGETEVRLYLEHIAPIVTYAMSYETTLQVIANPAPFIASVKGEVTPRRDGKIPSDVVVTYKQDK